MGTAEQTWLELVTDVLQDPFATLPEERIAVALHETFRANGCAFHRRDGARALPAQRIWPAAQHAPATVVEMNDWAVHSAAQGHPVLRYYLATHDTRALQVADVPAAFAPPRVVEAWNEIGGRWGIASQVAIPLSFGPAGHRAFVVGREDRFTAGEMALAARLQRLLAALDRQLAALTRWTGTGVDPAAAGASPLTGREIAVLALVAEGLTSAAVARRLAIGERTVHKHLERIYAKLGVRDRLSAVLRAQRAGVLAAAAR